MVLEVINNKRVYSAMKNKKAFTGMIGWIVFAIAIIFLILLFRNDMDFKAVVEQITGFFGR